MSSLLCKYCHLLFVLLFLFVCVCDRDGKMCWAEPWAHGSTVEEQPVLIQPSNGSAGCSGNQWRREGAWNPRHLVALFCTRVCSWRWEPAATRPAVLPRWARPIRIQLRSGQRLLLLGHLCLIDLPLRQKTNISFWINFAYFTAWLSLPWIFAASVKKKG